MSDFIARQPVAIHDGTDERALTADKAIYISITDGTETANVNASNQLEVAVGNSVTVVDGGGSITVDGSVTVSATDLDIRDLSASQDNVLVYANTAKDGSGTNYVPVVTSDGYLRVDIASGAAAGYEYQDGDSATGAYGRVILGTDGTNLQIASVDTNGRLNVNIVDSLPAGSNSIGDIGTVGTITNVVHIDDNSGSITVDGTVAATQSGTWDINSVTTVGTITNVVHIDDNAGSITVDGTVAATQSGTWNIGTLSTITNPVTIQDGGNVITVDGTVTIQDGGNVISIDDAGSSITVDATNLDIRDLTSASDSVEVLQDTHDDLNCNANIQIGDADASLTNPVPVHIVNNPASANEIDDYQTTASVTKNGGTTTHTYTVTAGKTLIIDSISVAASGKMKYTIKTGPAASEVTKKVGFTSASNPDYQYLINGKIEVAAGNNVLIILQNDDNTDMDVHSTLLGNEV